MGSFMKEMTKRVQKLCLEVQNLRFLHTFTKNDPFAPFRSGVQNHFCHFFMDEPIESFSPLQCVDDY